MTDLLKILQEIRGTGAAEVEYTDGIYWDMTIKDYNGNTGIYGDILVKHSEISNAIVDVERAEEAALNSEASADAASTSESNASTSESNAAASADFVDDLFLGTKAFDPSTDNDGGVLQIGAMYYNTTLNPKQVKIWDGAAWNQAYFSASGAVITFNGRDGDVSLTKTDVDIAIGFTAIEFTSVEKTKLGNIEDNATTDQTDAEISVLMKDYTESLTNKELVDPSNHIHARRLDLEAKNTSGLSIPAGSPVTFTEVTTEDNYEILLTDQLTMIAHAVTAEEILSDAIGTVVISGRCPFNTENYIEGEVLYVNGGALTNVEPSTGYSQPIAIVLKDAVDGILQVLATYPKQDADDVRYSAGVSVKTKLDSKIDTEVDPIFTASQANNITSQHIIDLSNLSGSNTGDQDLSALITNTSVQALHATEAFSISDHTITLTKADNTTETVVTPDTTYSIQNGELSENNLTTALKNNYDTAYTHSQAIHAPTDAEANTVNIDTVNVFTAAQRGNREVITYAASVTPDFALSNRMEITLTGDIIINNPNNLVANQGGVVYIIQAGLGEYAITWGSKYAFLNTDDSTGVVGDVQVYAYEVFSTDKIVMTYIGVV